MKRKFTDMNGDSDSDDFNNFQSQRTHKRHRRQKICISPLQSESDNDTIINNNDPNSQKLPNENISKSNKWTCIACTFDNSNTSTNCEMCDTSPTNNINIKTNNNIKDDNDAENDSDINESTNIFSKRISTKHLRKSKPKPKIKKQISIVDLTQNDIIINKNKKQSKLKLISKPKLKNKNKNKKQEPKMSCINGNRSRLKYYSKKGKINKKNKTKKNKLTKTESIESIDENELLLNSKKNMENISDNDCIIINKINKSKKKKNGNVKFILNNKINKNKLQTEQWIDKYKPQTMNDLYLHSKKLKEIDEWFSNAFKSLDNINKNNLHNLMNIKSILFLVGASGIGKTSIIECICNKYNAKLLCYPNEHSNIKIYNQSIWDNNKTHFMSFYSENKYKNNISIYEPSQMNKFNSFLNVTKRFNSLNLFSNKNNNKITKSNKRQIILIKELPYVGKDEYLYKFRNIVLNICNSTRNIIIFEITTEFEGTKDCLQIFGNDIRYHTRVNTIRFNPINKTLMKKCLNNILINEKLNKSILNSNILIQNIIQNEKGDLRNAIQTLQMRLVQLLYNKNNNTKKTVKKNNKKKKSKNKIKKFKLSSLKSVNVGGKEETLSLFHSLGKILYAKKEIEPEEAIEKSDLDCIIFNDLLYENFSDYFIYNTHFINNNKNKNMPQQFDEFGFEINDIMESGNDILFEKYSETLNYFADADICCSYYNKLKYNDTSTDLRSSVNHIQFGSQLYPSIYSASIASRGYLISHNKIPKLKLPNNKSNGLNAIRGSTYKLINNLRKQLCQSFNDIILPKHNISNINGNGNEYYINENELGLMRSLMCYPTSLYVDIFPMIANIKNGLNINKCGINELCVSLIKNSNYYSQKYEWKTFHASRFDYIQKSISYNGNNNNNNNRQSDDDDKELIDEIEQFD